MYSMLLTYRYYYVTNYNRVMETIDMQCKSISHIHRGIFMLKSYLSGRTYTWEKC